MRFSAFAGVAIVPLLARLVLVGAFLPQGASKVFTNRTFEGRAAEILAGLGVAGTRPAATVTGVAFQETRSLREIYPQAQPPADPAAPGVAPPPGEPAAPAAAPAGDAAASTAAPPAQDPPAAPAGTAQPVAAPPIEARSLYGIAFLLVEKGGWPMDAPVKATHMAWLAALTELIGGGLLLAGLFSRIWGLGLAITMGFAYAMTSWAAPIDPNPFALATDLEAFNRLYCQLGLLVLALGVFLTGPGPVSLDRVVFGGGRKDRDGLDEPAA
jgi:uncharacterized membrane protein YphA (DoxX/SURF4 family)